MLFDVVGKRKWFYLGVDPDVVAGASISLILPGGLRPGIDFSSGSIMTIRFEQKVDQAGLRDQLVTSHHPEAIVQKTSDSTGGSTFIVRVFTLKPEEKDASGAVTQQSERQRLEQSLREKFGNMDVLTFDSVSPVIAEEIVRNAVVALAAASVGILLYIA